jgi:hypothetical protein
MHRPRRIEFVFAAVLLSSDRRDDLRDAKHRHIEDCGSGTVVRHLPTRRE